MVDMASTREVFGPTLVELGREDQRIVVLGADLNKSTTAALFGQMFPERFFDMGAAEQNMIGVAAGLAVSGKIPFCNTFAVFGSGRAFDQIRVSVAQPGLNVKIVVTHAGLLTGEDGMSAQSIEDLALMLSLPGFNVIVPADAHEAAEAVRIAAQTPGPFYIRLSRPATPVIHSAAFRMQFGQAEVMRAGDDATILACGVMVSRALEAADLLAKQDIRTTVLNVATLAPLDQDAIVRVAKDTGALVTAEEHFMRGGLNSVVSQVVSRNSPVPVVPVALEGYGESGRPDELLVKYGLTAAKIVDAVKKAISMKPDSGK